MQNHYKYTTDIHSIFAKKQFELLDDKEKHYAYHFSRASIDGEKICLFEVSHEAPAIFALLHLAFLGENLEYLKKRYAGKEETYQQIIAYSGSFMGQLGNYRSFASTKFVPQCSAEEFYEFVKNSQSYKQYGGLMEELWAAIRELLYDLRPYVLKIGQWPKGVTGYYSNNLTEEEVDLADELLSVLNVSELNTHIYKKPDSTIVIKVCSVNQKTTVHSYKKRRFELYYGFLGPFLRRIIEGLQRAHENASNITQRRMLDAYIEHFRTGDIELHKESQRHWVQDKGPIVETNLGFIETYLDPKQVRAYYEGMVAVVDKYASKVVEKLVLNAERLLEKYIPWPKEFEKDKFLKPDFTSLDIVTFASFDTPRGINIPNYDCIRGEIGFKNVFLANNIVKPKKRPLYLNEVDGQLLVDIFDKVSFHQVSYHELLGHGCGKLFTEKDGHFNFDKSIVDPLTGKPVESWYVGNETWATKFKSLTNPYEECRADSVALYYSCFEDAVLLIQPEFGADWQKLRDAVWISFVNMGINVLEFYNREDKKWMQAHSNGRFVILQVLLEAGQDFIKIYKTKKDEKDWIGITIDRTKIETVGLPALKHFLLRLNVYKATANLEAATKMYAGYSEVNEQFLELRDIVLANKSERGLEVKGNIVSSGGKYQYREYSSDFEGIIQSKMEAHPYFDIELVNEWRNLRIYHS